MEEHKNEVFELIMSKSINALETIDDIMNNSEDDGHRLKAAQDLLNRGGMKQVQEINVTHTNTTSPAEVILGKINALAPKERDEDIIDAEVEEDGNDREN